MRARAIQALRGIFRSIHFSTPLAVKIMGIVVLFVCLLGLIVIVVIRSFMADILSEQLEKRAIAIGREVASESLNRLLVGDVFSLYEKTKSVATHNDDVRYVLILDEKGQLEAHNFSSGIPEGLMELRTFPTPLTDADVLQVNSEEGILLDVMVPIAEGKAGWVRVGMSEAGMRRTINSLSTMLMATTVGIAVLGLLGAFIMAQLITRPVKKLVRASQSLAEGDLTQRVAPRGRDEVGQLSTTFNRMADSLEQYNLEREGLLSELLEKEKIRRELLNKVITAQEEERKRIARELHDETGQSLTSLTVGLKALVTCPDLEESRRMAGELRAVAAVTLEEVHRLAVQLRPTVLDDMGLLPALERYVAEYKRQHYVKYVDLHVQNDWEQRLPPEIETTLYRIVQEALTNIAKYAEARNASIILKIDAEGVNLVVEDDGVGFDLEGVLNGDAGRPHLGLAGMEERTTLLGGNFTVESQPGQGTTIYVRLPLKWSEFNEGKDPFALGG